MAALVIAGQISVKSPQRPATSGAEICRLSSSKISYSPTARASHASLLPVSPVSVSVPVCVSPPVSVSDSVLVGGLGAGQPASTTEQERSRISLPKSAPLRDECDQPVEGGRREVVDPVAVEVATQHQ
jgi:hypothetical protein